MRSQVDVKKNDEDGLEQDIAIKVKLTKACVVFKGKFIEMLSDLAAM